MDYYSTIMRNKVLIYDIDEPWKHYGGEKKPVPKDHISWDPIYMQCPEEVYLDSESELVAA